MKEHFVKSWPEFFDAILNNKRMHELRRNDRNYAIDDYLLLHEYDPWKKTFTGRFQKVKITSITSADIPCAVSKGALKDEFCILSVQRIGEAK